MTGQREHEARVKRGQVWRGPSGHEYKVLNDPAYGWVDLVDARGDTYHEDGGVLIADVTYEIPLAVLTAKYERIGAKP